MKLIVVPRDTAPVLLAALEAAGVKPEKIGGLTVMATRLCPPGKAFLLDAQPIEVIKPWQEPTFWDTRLDEYLTSDRYSGMTFSIDYLDWMVRRNVFPRSPWYRRWWKSLRDWWHWAYEDFKATFDHMWQ